MSSTDVTWRVRMSSARCLTGQNAASSRFAGRFADGAASVLGSVLAMLVALLVGFRMVVLTGAACYVVALALGRQSLNDEPSNHEPERRTPNGERRTTPIL